ncbi:MAG: putative ATP-dependent helicase, partial [Bacteroidetes bacterium]|nr:putative ATP-dependent helicase [Bacteroidota bacterium]
MSSYFYLKAEQNAQNSRFIQDLEKFSNDNKKLIYVLDRPLTDQKYSYKYTKALIVLSPKNKIAIIDYGYTNEWEDYVEDVLEDVGSISDKYLYKDIIGRPRKWKDVLLDTFRLDAIEDIDDFFKNIELVDEKEKKKLDLIISLFIGSINDVERVKEDVPTTVLDKVKQKIQLFDGDQTRFIYEEPKSKRITIQGLS